MSGYGKESHEDLLIVLQCILYTHLSHYYQQLRQISIVLTKNYWVIARENKQENLSVKSIFSPFLLDLKEKQYLPCI